MSTPASPTPTPLASSPGGTPTQRRCLPGAEAGTLKRRQLHCVHVGKGGVAAKGSPWQKQASSKKTRSWVGRTDGPAIMGCASPKASSPRPCGMGVGRPLSRRRDGKAEAKDMVAAAERKPALPGPTAAPKNGSASDG